MRKIAFLAVVALLAVAVAASATAKSDPVTIDYQADGCEGILTFGSAEGQLYVVFDVYGACMAEGVVCSPDYEIPCPNSGPDANGTLLNVTVGGIMYAIGDRDTDWLWD